MRRTVYYAIEAITTLIVSSLIWYIFLINASFDFYHRSDNIVAVIMLLSGMIFYVILTVFYVILGFKKVKGWRWWMSITTVIVSLAMGFAGMFGAAYGSEFINSILH